jgi:multidrug resistance protein, MATE family
MTHWYRRVFLLAVPLILSNLTQPLLATVDTALSGHLPGAAALGGVALGGVFFDTIYWSFGFLRMSTTGLVAQAQGAGQREELRMHFLRSLLLALCIGALVLALQAPLISLTLRLLGASPEAAANASLYCHVRIWSAPAALANFAILGYLLGRQRAKLALLLQVVINLVNVCVALLLVLRMHWGVTGIATGTAIAEWIGCLLGLALVERSVWAPIRWHDLIDSPKLKKLFALNRDILLRTVSLAAAYLWFARAGAHQGDVILAANAVLMNLHYIAAYGLDGFANATETLVGESIGAQKIENYRAVLRASWLWAVAVAALTSLTYLVAGPWLIPLFTNVKAVQTLALHFLPWAVALPIISVASFQLDGIFIGATRGRELRNAMIISFLVFLAAAIALQHSFGNNGLWCAFCGFMAARAITLAVRLKRIEVLFPITARFARVDSWT